MSQPAKTRLRPVPGNARTTWREAWRQARLGNPDPLARSLLVTRDYREAVERLDRIISGLP